LKILTSQRLTRRLKNLGFVESRPYDDYGSQIYAWVNVSFTEDFDKEIPADVKAEQKKIDDKYTHTYKKILYWQQLGIILDSLSEQLGNSSDRRKGPNHAQISLKEHENKSSLSQLETNGFSIVAPPFEGVQVKINPYLRKVGEKKVRTQGNNVCVRAINFKVFLDREKSQLKHPRFVRSLSKNQRIKLDSNLTQTNELPKNQSFSVSTPQTNSAQNNKDLTTSDLLRIDLKNYASLEYNSVVDNVPVFVGDFNKKYPGFVKSLGLQAVLSNAERLNERGWSSLETAVGSGNLDSGTKTKEIQTVNSRVVSEEEGLRILKEEGINVPSLP